MFVGELGNENDSGGISTYCIVLKMITCVCAFYSMNLNEKEQNIPRRCMSYVGLLYLCEIKDKKLALFCRMIEVVLANFVFLRLVFIHFKKWSR